MLFSITDQHGCIILKKIFELLGGRSPQAYVSDDRRDSRVGTGHLPRGADVEAQRHAGTLRLRTPLFETTRDLPRTYEEVSFQFNLS